MSGPSTFWGMLPKGTHDLCEVHSARGTRRLGPRPPGLTLADLTGLHYSPITETFSLGGNIDVNYLAHFRAGHSA